MKINKTFQVTVSVDTEEAREIKNGKGDWDAYPNWDINYLGEEKEFIKTLIRELTDHNKYSGIEVTVREVKNAAV